MTINPSVEDATTSQLGAFDSATLHEAMRRQGAVDFALKPIQRRAHARTTWRSIVPRQQHGPETCW